MLNEVHLETDFESPFYIVVKHFVFVFVCFLLFSYFLAQDLVVHVRDISHPECDAHLEDVLSVLQKQLSLKASLVDNMVEVQNKTDLW